MKFYILGYFWILFQTNHPWEWMAKAVYEQYPEVASEESDFYEIKLQDQIPVLLFLTHQENRYYGSYIYYQEKTIYTLSGEKNDQYIHLTEWDSQGSSSGLVSIDLDDGKIQGIWSNLDRSLEMTWEGKKIESIAEYTWPEWNNWLKVYDSKISTKPYYLILQKDQARLSGCFHDGIKHRSFSFSGECQDHTCKNLILTLKDPKQQESGEITGQILNDDYILITYKPLGEASTYFSLSLAQDHDMTVDFRLKYFSLQDVSYPSLPQAKANNQILEFIQEQRGLMGKPNREEKVSDARLRHQLYVWSETVWLNDRIYSGTIWAQHYAKDTLLALNLNYDFKQNKDLSLDQFFKRNTDYQVGIQDYLRQELVDHPKTQMAGTIDKPNLISPEDFTIYNLLPEGLLMSTSFNVGSGYHKILIPYNYFGNQINRKILQEYFGKY